MPYMLVDSCLHTSIRPFLPIRRLDNRNTCQDWHASDDAYMLLTAFSLLPVWPCNHYSTGSPSGTAALHIHDKVSKIQNYGILWHVSSIKSTVSSCHCEDRDANKLTQSVIAAS